MDSELKFKDTLVTLKFREAPVTLTVFRFGNL